MLVEIKLEPVAQNLLLTKVCFMTISNQFFANCLYGGFQLLDLIIPELKSHVIPYKFKSSHWLKLQHSD